MVRRKPRANRWVRSGKSPTSCGGGSSRSSWNSGQETDWAEVQLAENAECDHFPVAAVAVGPLRAVRTKSTVHDWFQRWAAAGIFERIWAVLVAECDELGGVQWEWQPADAMLGKARFGGKKTGKNPTDRGGHQKEHGDRWRRWTAGGGDRRGERAGTEAPGATIESIVVERPEPTKDEPQHMPLDKAYDNPTGEGAATAAGYTPHIRRIGEEKKGCDRSQGHKPRRWVVERTFAGCRSAAGSWCGTRRRTSTTSPDSAGLRTVLVSQAPPHGSM